MLFAYDDMSNSFTGHSHIFTSLSLRTGVFHIYCCT